MPSLMRGGGSGGPGMLNVMRSSAGSNSLLLLMDTCGERASLALVAGGILLQERVLAERTASASLLAALRELLAAEQRSVGDLSAVGLVSGPGSFTGVRVGLALAKGLCEATGVPLATVSRLAVLSAAASLVEGYALLSAGKQQVFARSICTDMPQQEWLTSLEELTPRLASVPVAVASPELAAALYGHADVRQVELSARHALEPVQRCLAEGGSDVALSDANYVRDEGAIYARVRSDLGAQSPS